MGDHTTETLDLQSRRDDEEYAREVFLVGGCLNLDEDTISWILSHTDCFISQCRGNDSIEIVFLYPYAFDGQDDEVLDRVGLAIGNLQALKNLIICTHKYRDDTDYSNDDDNEEVVPRASIPDWEIVARILSHVRQSVTIIIDDERLRTIEEV
jgi:hypothetical protein